MVLSSNQTRSQKVFSSAIFVKTYRQMSTSWSSSVQLHSYKSLQLSWLWFIRSPSSWTALAGASSQTFLKARTLAASLYTCFARWYSLKVGTRREVTLKKWIVSIYYGKENEHSIFLYKFNLAYQIQNYAFYCYVSTLSKSTSSMKWIFSGQGFLIIDPFFCCKTIPSIKPVTINTGNGYPNRHSIVGFTYGQFNTFMIYNP